MNNLVIALCIAVVIGAIFQTYYEFTSQIKNKYNTAIIVI